MASEDLANASRQRKEPEAIGVTSDLELSLLGSNQDSPDPESVPLGQRFRSSCSDTVTYRASVPASLPQNARLCPEKL